MHSFPKDERQRAAWTRFVKLTRADWTGPSQYTVICSEHFNEECYERQHFLMKDFGIPTKKTIGSWIGPFHLSKEEERRAE